MAAMAAMAAVAIHVFQASHHSKSDKVAKTIIIHPLGMVYTTYKHGIYGDDWGMVYDSFTHITGYYWMLHERKPH